MVFVCHFPFLCAIILLNKTNYRNVWINLLYVEVYIQTYVCSESVKENMFV